MSPRAPHSRQLRLAVAGSAAALAITGLVATAAPASGGPPGDGFTIADTQPTLTGRSSGDKAPSSSMAETSPSLLKLDSAKRVPVVIKYDYDAIASYTGTVPGLAATSPSVTGRPVTAGTSALRDYRAYVNRQERAISRRVEAAVPATSIDQSYQVAYGGVSAVVPGNQIRTLLAVPGVVAVQRDALRQPLTDSSTRFINATAAYEELRTTRSAGKGIILANIDTGLWPEHPSFADHGNLSAPPGPARACAFGDNPLTPADDPFVCNNKLIGGQPFLDTYAALNDDLVYPGTARDSEGHGSHTSSTSAGDIVTNVKTLGPTLSRVNGVAPGAWVVEYKALGPQGGYASDLTAAVQQAIVDGADVINYSISGGSSPLTDSTELAFLDAYNAGVFVAASAGNSGPGASTSDHLSPWVTTVAASTQTRSFTSTLTLTAGDGATYSVKGASITAGAGPAPVTPASAAPYGDPLCQTPAPAGTFTGQIVVCQRGVNGRVEKGYNVLQGGAAGMILYNPTLADVETDNHWLPSVHVADGTDLTAFLAAHSGVTASFTAGRADTGKGDVMAAFSSRGPGGSFIKPDITAPGVQILAAMTPTPTEVVNGPPGEYYQVIAGTSMSAPHIAGAAILLKALHPGWTPGQIKSAMMTQSLTKVVKEDETTPADAFDMGAGRIDVGRAADAPMTISDTTDDMLAYTADPVHAIDLNIPSINAPTMPGYIDTVRTVQNVTGKTLHVKAYASLPDATEISFSPRSFTLKPGRSTSVEMRLTSDAPIGAQQFGTVYFDTNRGDLHLPVAFIRQQGTVTATQSCDPASVRVKAMTTCTISATNTDFDAQAVSFTTTTNDRLQLTGTTAGRLRGGKVSGLTTLAGASLGVPSVAPASDSPGGGFLDLAGFGIAPISVGDEDVLNFTTPSFMFNGKAASSIGIDTNGYLVVGGATSEDNECCTLPSGASSARPNNVLAPFWSDLNGTGAPGVRVGTLTDGVSQWIVVQWDVNVFGTTDTRHFQVWIGTQPTQDITYEYSAPQTDPGGQPFLVGAENEAGEGDMSATLPTGTLRVTSTDPTPGDTFTYTVTAKGVKKGSGVVHTELTAPKVPGVTTLDSDVSVTR
ncbi:S8 family serine peptidase [Nocardioides sp. LMS-CY]|uniref:S8 family serine peptidase n=1 Tax=Nocardioides sp. (strain LMS-CY) TaxID=2840457 RepID=UPI002079DEA8|nr:S8 family serine peptidase [Nocardioides sp. LMS-CY]